MDEKAKYAIVLVLAVLVSLGTSYLFTTYFHSNAQITSSNSPQTTQEPTSTQQPAGTKIFLPYNISITQPGGISFVTVYSDITVYNLTIVYQYKTDSGSTVTKSVVYGNFYPSWGPGVVVTPGQTPSSFLEIPPEVFANGQGGLYSNGNYYWIKEPQFTVTVYGFT